MDYRSRIVVQVHFGEETHSFENSAPCTQGYPTAFPVEIGLPNVRWLDFVSEHGHQTTSFTVVSCWLAQHPGCLNPIQIGASPCFLYFFWPQRIKRHHRDPQLCAMTYDQAARVCRRKGRWVDPTLDCSSCCHKLVLDCSSVFAPLLCPR